MLENLNILISYDFFDDTIYNIYSNSCLNYFYYFYFFKFLTCGFNGFYGFYIITEVPFSQLWPQILPWTLPSPLYDFYLNFEFYLGSLDPDFYFCSPYSSKLFGWLYCCGTRDRDTSPDVEMQVRRSTNTTRWIGWRYSDNFKTSADYEFRSGFGFGYDTPVNDKGKGKEIPKDTEIPIEIPKNSLDSCTSSNNNSIMPKGYRDSCSSTNYCTTSSSCPPDLYHMQIKPKTPQNTPSTSRFDIQKPNSSNGNGGSGWFSNLLENFFP